MSRIIQLSAQSFEHEVLQSATPVLVDYWAPWCGPCRAVAPVVEEMAEHYVDRLKVAKVNVDDHQAIAMRYGIRSIPTLMLFRDGEVVAAQSGAISRNQMDSFLQSHLG